MTARRLGRITQPGREAAPAVGAARWAAASSAAYAADLGAVLLIGGLMAAGGPVDVRILVGALAVPVIHAVGFQAPRQVAALGVAAIAVAAAGLAAADRSLLVPLLALAPVVAVAPLVAVPVHAMRARLLVLGRREAEARRLADADALTGVGNYRVFWRALQAETARSARHGQPFSLAIVDLDDFKLVNDEHGHRMGDEALRAVADGLRSAVRASDVLCRQGGDEFAVVAAPSGPEDIEALAERLVSAVAVASSARGLPRQITASAGTATFGEGGDTPEALVEAAELSLQAAKRDRHGGRARSRATAAARPVGSTRPPHGVARHGHPSVRLALLGHLARALTAVRGERAIATTAVAHVAGAVDVRTVAVVKRHPRDGRLELLALGGPAAERAPGDYRVADGAPLSVALRERRPALVVDDVGRGPAERTGAPASQLAVPVPWNGELWGALALESEHPGGYDPREVELVDAMAGQVGRSLRVGALLDELAELLHHGRGETFDDRADPHGRAVSHLAVTAGRRLGLDQAQIGHLRVAALFHELGAVCAPAAVVEKSGHLTDEEFAILRDHPLVGARLLHSLEGLQEAARIVRAERERYDGQGYPAGLAGSDIPLPARVLHACDAYVAMTTRRPYRAAVSADAALDELERGAGTQFDPAVVDAVVDAVGGARRLSSPT